MVKKNISFRKKRGGKIYETTYNSNKNEVKVQYVDMDAKISDKMAQERQQFQADKEKLQTNFDTEKKKSQTKFEAEKNEMKRVYPVH